MKKPDSKGIHVPIENIFPNRLNPNVMKDWGPRLRLRSDIKADDYDPIIVSPATTFYGETLNEIIYESESGTQVAFTTMLERFKISPKDAFVICDGEQRHREAIEVGLTEIRCKIEYWSEDDAMPHFYKRQTIRGEMDPFKEAELFLYERRVKGLELKEIKEKYNLGSTTYIRNRLRMYKVVDAVLRLFWDPPEKAPGKLTYSHLEEISRVPMKYQRPVALMSLYRNWTAKNVRTEARRIKAQKGIRDVRAYIEAATNSPPPRPKGTIIKPDSKIEQKEIASDEEIFKEYPEEYFEKGPVMVRDERVEVSREPIIPIRRREHDDRPRVVWPHESADPKPRTEIYIPLILNGELLENITSIILRRAAEEGLDLKLETVEETPIREWLKIQANEGLSEYQTFKYPRGLLKAALRLIQLWTIESHQMKTTQRTHVDPKWVDSFI